MIFGTKARITQVSSFRACFGNYELDRVSEFKYLSVALDENLSWKAHVNYLITKGGKSVGVLGRLWKNLTVAAVNAMYKSLIAPIFDYCDSVWSCCNKCDAGRLERLQRRAARIVALMSDSSDTAMQKFKMGIHLKIVETSMSLRTVLPFVTTHTFCASRDIRAS